MEENTIVQSAILQYVTQPSDYKSSDETPRLWASDLNKCPRKAIIRTRAIAVEPVPDPRMQLYFQAGNIWEDDTLAAMQHTYGDALTDQLVLKNDLWAGKCDFALHHEDADKQTILIEHKATGGKWFDYNNGLPKGDHLGQLYVYWTLYQELYGSVPKVVLFYRAWGNYAEFYPDFDNEEYVNIHGVINGKAVVRRRYVNLAEKMKELELAYAATALPPRLLDKDAGCTFRGKPSCPFYDFCWSENNMEEVAGVEDVIRF